ncbi:MAG: homocysteine S-methyltransferase family protein [Clostridia bacterium]|nr:homocysteine S-methyltransferase family protein [Clostridia bacterium]
MLRKLGRKVLIFDGGFGSELQRLGLPDTCPEDLNITHPDAVQQIHRSYACADFITTNTFGLNRKKYRGNYPIADVVRAAVANARAAGKTVMYDIGPTGALMQPLGPMSFDEAYETYSEVASLASDLADGFILETFTDLYELKAAVLAVREHTDKPVFATMTFDESGRTLTGSSPEIMVNTLEGLGVDALGVNCSLGPKALLPIVKRILACANVPVLVQPNRGLPKVINGKTVYDLPFEEFESCTEEFVKEGVAVIGGCCGTTPELIERLTRYRGTEIKRHTHRLTRVNSASRMVQISGVRICGERLNPTGKKALKEAILSEQYEYLVGEAVRQEDAGAEILDLNVGIPRIDEAAVMKKAVLQVQEYCSLPLQIDSSSVQALETGCRYYNGIPLINSVNGEDEVMDKIFPIAKKYGAVVVGLTLDRGGVPQTAEERVAIAKRIIARAKQYGIPKNRILIDTLTLAVSAQQKAAAETLKALRMVRALGVGTVLGVSNVSFGLPDRPLLNRTFLCAAMDAGLNMPIMNPLDAEMKNAVYAYRVLSGEDTDAKDYIEKLQTQGEQAPVQAAETSVTLTDAVIKGLRPAVPSIVRGELATREPMEIVNGVLLPALQKVGELFEAGKIFLPQLIASAETVKDAFGILSAKMEKNGEEKGVVVMATVRGDVHDIGKNICKVVMESYGYRVYDLGKDVSEEEVVGAWKKYKPDCIGLSALMTTTVSSMESTINALREAGCTTPVMVGGAVLTQQIADEIGADYYSKDALGCVSVMGRIMEGKKTV